MLLQDPEQPCRRDRGMYRTSAVGGCRVFSLNLASPGEPRLLSSSDAAAGEEPSPGTEAPTQKHDGPFVELGLYWDNGKENGHYYIMIGYILWL